jgi:hypothetical protein
MGYPKVRCNVPCFYLSRDSRVCTYLGDIEEALTDPNIPPSCPWTQKALVVVGYYIKDSGKIYPEGGG